MKATLRTEDYGGLGGCGANRRFAYSARAQWDATCGHPEYCFSYALRSELSGVRKALRRDTPPREPGSYDDSDATYPIPQIRNGSRQPWSKSSRKSTICSGRQCLEQFVVAADAGWALWRQSGGGGGAASASAGPANEPGRWKTRPHRCSCPALRLPAYPDGRVPPLGAAPSRIVPIELPSGPRDHPGRRRDRTPAWLRACAMPRPRDRCARIAIGGIPVPRPSEASPTLSRTARTKRSMASSMLEDGDVIQSGLCDELQGRLEVVGVGVNGDPNSRTFAPDRHVGPMVSGPDRRQVMCKSPLRVEVTVGRLASSVCATSCQRTRRPAGREGFPGSRRARCCRDGPGG